MFNLLFSELFRLRKRTKSWLLFVINVMLTALVYGGFVIAARVSSGGDSASMRQDATFSSFEDLGISVAIGFFAAVMLTIVASGMMGNEYSWNTLRPLVARSRSRVGLLTAKLIALLIYALLFVFALVAVLVVFYFLGSMVVGEPSGFSMSVLGDGIVLSLKLLFVSMPYLALAFMLATVAKSNAAGIAGALGLSFIESPVWMLLGLASDFFEKLQKWGISYNVEQISASMPLDDTPNVTRSVLILLAYIGVFLGATYAVFMRRDVTSG